MSTDPTLAESLSIAEAHANLWALFVRHADGTLELHKTDTFKMQVESEDIELEEWLRLLRPDSVACTEAFDAEVELLGTCFLCSRLYDTE